MRAQAVIVSSSANSVIVKSINSIINLVALIGLSVLEMTIL